VACTQAVEPYLAKEKLCKTLSGSSHLHKSLFLVRGDKVTLLHVAVLLKDRALIELLLRHGANPNQSAEALSKTYVPLDPKKRKVCRPDELRRSVELLVERGTPLHLALMTDNAEAAVRLLQAGADPWLKARKAKSTFTSSFSVTYADVIRELLQRPGLPVYQAGDASLATAPCHRQVARAGAWR
jgi:hypothetical protein